ncbi:MAG: hypothetical protein M3033_14345 [Acidobacteriota bacterium]|nr:hypothetical protein [Acidobacteriota bacterium]
MNQTTMMEVLQVSQPLPELAGQLQLFGQLVGSRDVRVVNYKPDGSRQIVEAEWHFGWILEGRAIQEFGLRQNGVCGSREKTRLAITERRCGLATRIGDFEDNPLIKPIVS